MSSVTTSRQTILTCLALVGCVPDDKIFISFLSRLVIRKCSWGTYSCIFWFGFLVLEFIPLTIHRTTFKDQSWLSIARPLLLQHNISTNKAFFGCRYMTFSRDVAPHRHVKLPLNRPRAPHFETRPTTRRPVPDASPQQLQY
jgi:hypothetical protein